MTDIEPGFYLVKYGGEWEPAQKIEDTIYCRHCWRLLGTEDIYQTDELDEIGPKIELPDASQGRD